MQEKQFNPERPEDTTLTISIKSDSRGAGAAALAHLIGQALVGAGYQNVKIDSMNSPEGMAEIISSTLGEKRDALLKVKVDIKEIELPRPVHFRKDTKTHKLTAVYHEYMPHLTRNH